ncbi:MAG: lipopolysaccharide biosynthesis protein [Bacteroidetes bacterium]|nr:lipopolysaccharide biosynthesis protein [Bacteroidota bacterium]
MSTIRRQSIISSGLVYFGFALGFLFTLLFAKGFTPAEYGLVTMFTALSSIIYFVGNLGMPTYIYKFFPYYQHHLEPKKSDMLAWSLVVGMGGVVLVMVGGVVFKGLVIRKFGEQSPDLVKYYYWIFPFAFGYSLYLLLEAFAWQLKRSVLTSFLREVLLRFVAILLVVLFFVGVLKSFDTFIKLYAFSYLIIALCLLGVLIVNKEVHFTFQPSKVTRRFFGKIVKQAGMVWGGQMLYNLAQYIAQIVIAAVVPGGLKYVGIYTLGQYITSVIQAPQRGVIAAAIGPLSQAWREKDYGRIDRIYRRSSINQLIFSAGVFVLIWINFTDAVLTLHIKTDFLEAKQVFFFLGLMRIIDMGTGVTNQIIGTSTYWRFDFFTGVGLAAVTIPMNYILAKTIGFIGPAIADLFTFTIYNFIRWVFLYRKYGMQPFDRRTVLTLLLALGVYFVCHWLYASYQGFGWLVLRSATFIVLYGAGVLLLRLSEDVAPVWATVKKRVGIRR